MRTDSGITTISFVHCRLKYWPFSKVVWNWCLLSPRRCQPFIPTWSRYVTLYIICVCPKWCHCCTCTCPCPCMCALQRCKAYPIDTSTGNSMSVVNQKVSSQWTYMTVAHGIVTLCWSMHAHFLSFSCASCFTTHPPSLAPWSALSPATAKGWKAIPTLRLELATILSVQYWGGTCILHVLYPQANSSDLHEFATSHQRFVIYLETLTPYLQLRYNVHMSASCQ